MYSDQDLQLNWISDMVVEVNVMGVPAEVKEIEFKGELRITLGAFSKSCRYLIGYHQLSSYLIGRETILKTP